MKEEELKQTLMAGARDGGICADGYAEMRGYDRDKLIAMYLRVPDWCLERGFPSLELLRREFADIQNRGVYVDKHFDGETLSSKVVYVLHKCTGIVNVEMDYEAKIIPMLYFANGCDITVRCTQPNRPAIRVPLYVYGSDNNVHTDKADAHNAMFLFRYKTLITP